MSGKPLRCIAIMGATATGKSALAIDLALQHHGEIISMDSRQLYRGFDVGTGKVSAEERKRVPHHLLDILDPGESTSAGRHADRAREIVTEIAARGRVPVLAGGTGLYYRALFDGLVDVSIPGERLREIRRDFDDVATPTLYERLHERDAARASALSPTDRVRIMRALELIAYTGRPVTELYSTQSPPGAAVEAGMVVLTMPRDVLRERVARRTRELFDSGWVDEVRARLGEGVEPNAPAMNSLGYRDIVDALATGFSDGEGLVERVIVATRRYAKRQETFFRGFADATRIDVTAPGWRDAVDAAVKGYLESGFAP